MGSQDEESMRGRKVKGGGRAKGRCPRPPCKVLADPHLYFLGAKLVHEVCDLVEWPLHMLKAPNSQGIPS